MSWNAGSGSFVWFDGWHDGATCMLVAGGGLRFVNSMIWLSSESSEARSIDSWSEPGLRWFCNSLYCSKVMFFRSFTSIAPLSGKQIFGSSFYVRSLLFELFPGILACYFFNFSSLAISSEYNSNQLSCCMIFLICSSSFCCFRIISSFCFCCYFSWRILLFGLSGTRAEDLLLCLFPVCSPEF